MSNLRKKSKEKRIEIANKSVETRRSKTYALNLLYTFLELIKDNNKYHLNDIKKYLVENLSLSEEELNQTSPSG